MASKTETYSRGPALGQVLGDDRDLQLLYPEIAEATDLGATLRSNVRESLPLENWEGTPLEALLRAAGISSARQQSSRSLSLPGHEERSGLPELRPARQSFTFCPYAFEQKWPEDAEFYTQCLVFSGESCLNQRVQGSNPCTSTNEIRYLSYNLVSRSIAEIITRSSR